MIKAVIIIILYAIITGARRPDLYAVGITARLKPYFDTFLYNPYKYTLNIQKAVFTALKHVTRLYYKIDYYNRLTPPTAENVKNRRNYPESAPHNFDIKCQNFNIFIYAKNLVCVSFSENPIRLTGGGSI